MDTKGVSVGNVWPLAAFHNDTRKVRKARSLDQFIVTLASA